MAWGPGVPRAWGSLEFPLRRVYPEYILIPIHTNMYSLYQVSLQAGTGRSCRAFVGQYVGHPETLASI